MALKFIGFIHDSDELQGPVYQDATGKFYYDYRGTVINSGVAPTSENLKPLNYTPQKLQTSIQGAHAAAMQDTGSGFSNFMMKYTPALIGLMAGGAGIAAGAGGAFGGAGELAGAASDAGLATAANASAQGGADLFGTIGDASLAGGGGADFLTGPQGFPAGASGQGAFSEGLGSQTANLGGLLPQVAGNTAANTAAGSGNFLSNLFGGGGGVNSGTTGLGALGGLFGGGGGGGGVNGAGSLIGAGANLLSGSLLQRQAGNIASDLQRSGNPLNDPQRQQYQQLLSQLENNPTSFWQTNPVAVGQLNLAKNMFEANSAKMGTGGTQFSDYLKNVTDAASGTFNSQAQLLAGLGGFNLPAQGTNAAGQLQQQGLNFANAGQTLLGQGIGNLFKSQTNTQNLTPGTNNTGTPQPLNNPITDSAIQFA